MFVAMATTHPLTFEARIAAFANEGGLSAMNGNHRVEGLEELVNK
jgi:hypothetical protein